MVLLLGLGHLFEFIVLSSVSHEIKILVFIGIIIFVTATLFDISAIQNPKKKIEIFFAQTLETIYWVEIIGGLFIQFF